MLNSTQIFLDDLERWVKAIREDNFEAARACARQLIHDGEPLAAHPDFRKCFTTQSEGSDPHEALRRLCQFLMCATDGRATVIENFICHDKPRPSPGSGAGSDLKAGASPGPASGPASGPITGPAP